VSLIQTTKITGHGECFVNLFNWILKRNLLQESLFANWQIRFRFICPTHPKSFVLGGTWIPTQITWLKEAPGQDQILHLKKSSLKPLIHRTCIWQVSSDLVCSGLGCSGVGLFPQQKLSRTVLLKVMKSKCSKSVWQLKDCSVPSKSPMTLNRTQSCFADRSPVKCIHLKTAVVQTSTCIKEKHNRYYSHISICKMTGPWPLSWRLVP